MRSRRHTCERLFHSFFVVTTAVGAEPLVTLKDNSTGAAVAFSPDGKTLIVASGSVGGSMRGQVRQYDAADGKPREGRITLAEPVEAMAITPDGIFQGPRGRPYRFQRGELKVFDLGSGKELRTLDGPTMEQTGLAFSADGKRLAAGGTHAGERGQALTGGSIRLWDTATGEVQVNLTGHKGIVQSLAFSPDGGTLASVSRVVPPRGGLSAGEVKLWDLQAGKERATFALPGAG